MLMLVGAVNICVWGGEMRDGGSRWKIIFMFLSDWSVFWLSLCKHRANTHNSKHEHLNTCPCQPPACLPPLIKNWLASNKSHLSSLSPPLFCWAKPFPGQKTNLLVNLPPAINEGSSQFSILACQRCVFISFWKKIQFKNVNFT